MAEISNKKVIAKNSIYLYLRMIIVMGISLVSVRLILRELGVVDFGLYNAIGGVVTAMSFITTIMASSSQRFFSVGIAQGDIEEQKRNFCAVIQAFGIIVIIGALLIEPIGLWFVVEKMNIPEGRYMECLYVFHLSILTLLIHLLTTPFHSLVVAHEDMNIYAAVSVLDAFLKLGCVLILSYNLIDKLVLYAVALTVEALCMFCLYFLVSRKYSELHFSMSFEFNRIKQILSFSSWTLVGALAGTATNQVTNILLNIFSGPIANAAFAISNQVGVAINTCGFGFFNAVRPPLMKSYASGEVNQTSSLFNMSNKLMFVFLMFAVVPLFVNTHEILDIWIGTDNPYSVVFTRIMILSFFVQCLANPITAIVQAAGKVKHYHLFVDGFILLSIIPSYVLMRIGCDAQWVLGVNLIFFSAGHFIRLAILKRIANLNINITIYFRQFLIPAVLILITSILIFYFVSTNIKIEVIKIILTTVLNIIYIIASSFFFLLNKSEKSIIISKFINIHN